MHRTSLVPHASRVLQAGFTSTDGGNRTSCDALVDPERMRGVYAVVVDFRVQLAFNLTGQLTWETAQRSAGLSANLVNGSGLSLAAQVRAPLPASACLNLRDTLRREGPGALKGTAARNVRRLSQTDVVDSLTS
jgi:hypothetical protein